MSAKYSYIYLRLEMPELEKCENLNYLLILKFKKYVQY